MKLLLTIILLISLLPLAIHAQSVNLEWARSMGGTDRDRGTSIITDALGNVYIVGHYKGTADFDPGLATFNMTSNGGYDVFVQKLDSAGNFVWARSIGGANDEQSWSISADILGNVYITGWFRGTVDFNPSPDTFNLTSVGNEDGFIQKLNTSGNFVWARSLGGTDRDHSVFITNDLVGNLYVTGYYSDTVDFNPGADTFNLSSNGQADVFIQKLDTGGNFVWARSMGGAFYDEGVSITFDALGYLYVTGSYRDTADFDPGSDTFNLISNGLYDCFIQKLDTSGIFIWARSMGGPSEDFGRSITTDMYGNVYTTGVYSDTADFDPSTAIFNLISNGQYDCFIQKLDAAGNFLWARSVGATSWDAGHSVTTDTSGNVYVTGRFEATVDFDPGLGTVNLTSHGNRDVFI
ncbi:MAG: SBBP repeat-containing protein, partial [Bacteroidetes bacterium]|nr:SBBP repeat-containing protein [Bacteroidota bacterium]